MIYRVYDHAKGATIFSVMTGVVSSGCILVGALLAILLVFWRFIPEEVLEAVDLKFNSTLVKIDIIIVVIGILSALASKFLSKMIAQKIIARKIKRSVNFAYKYTLDNPYLFRYAASLNKEFAYSYYLDKDDIVRKKDKKTRKAQKDR